MSDFRLTIIQTDPAWMDVGTNICKARELCREVGETDLIVFPEMFSTGFVTDPTGGVEPDGGESLALMKEIASAKDLPVLAEGLSQEGFSDREIEKIFYQNAMRFFEENL